MEGGDRGQDLVAPGALLGECALQDRDPLGDLGGVPQGAVLLVERHEPAGRVGARREAGVLEQHQRQQPASFRLRCGERELAGEADRLPGEVGSPSVSRVVHERQHA